MILSRQLSLILVLITILFFSFGMATMTMDPNGNMSDCPFANAAAICPMSFTEHIAIFQGTFRVIPPKIILFTILVMTFFLIAYSKVIPRNYSLLTKSKLFPEDKLELHIFNNFILALSDGIVQPRLYA